MKLATVIEAIAAHHRELTSKLAEQVTQLESETADGADLVAFLETELLPHAAGEEQYLYPVMDGLVKDYGSATATMRIDHEYIAETSRLIRELAQALRNARTDDERATQRVRLARLASQLEAILRLHVDKEERAYLPLFDEHLPASEQQAILDEMHESADAVSSAPLASDAIDVELDVRQLPPAQRHAVIFRTFDELPSGAAFVLVNDHDPKPLYYQLNAERAGQLAWEYLEEGPRAWRVHIGKIG